jgi:hypothetical protein
MNRACLLFAAVTALALGGCMTAGQTRQAQDACAELGAPKGTENHEACRSRVAAVQNQAVEAKTASPAPPASEPTPLPAKP